MFWHQTMQLQGDLFPDQGLLVWYIAMLIVCVGFNLTALYVAWRWRPPLIPTDVSCEHLQVCVCVFVL